MRSSIFVNRQVASSKAKVSSSIEGEQWKTVKVHIENAVHFTTYYSIQENRNEMCGTLDEAL